MATVRLNPVPVPDLSNLSPSIRDQLAVTKQTLTDETLPLHVALLTEIVMELAQTVDILLTKMEGQEHVRVRGCDRSIAEFIAGTI